MPWHKHRHMVKESDSTLVLPWQLGSLGREVYFGTLIDNEAGMSAWRHGPFTQTCTLSRIGEVKFHYTILICSQGSWFTFFNHKVLSFHELGQLCWGAPQIYLPLHESELHNDDTLWQSHASSYMPTHFGLLFAYLFDQPSVLRSRLATSFMSQFPFYLANLHATSEIWPTASPNRLARTNALMY